MKEPKIFSSLLQKFPFFSEDERHQCAVELARKKYQIGEDVDLDQFSTEVCTYFPHTPIPVILKFLGRNIRSIDLLCFR